MKRPIVMHVSARTRERWRHRWNRIRACFLPEPYRTVMPYTMVDLRRLRNLSALAHQIEALGIAGDIVECGACNGGSGALLARIAIRSIYRRHVWLLDSFEGLPAATAVDGDHAAEYTGACAGEVDNVRAVLRRSGVPEDRVTIVKGWFAQTVPSLEVGSIALLHIDADWYESVRIALDHLYDKVETCGFIVVDDYGYWEGCRTAIHDFFAERGVNPLLRDVDGIGVYFQKPA